jgi:hypothetical protein
MRNRFALAQFCTVAGRKGALALCLGLFMLASAFAASDHKGKFIKFDVKGAGNWRRPRYFRHRHYPGRLDHGLLH